MAIGKNSDFGRLGIGTHFNSPPGGDNDSRLRPGKLLRSQKPKASLTAAYNTAQTAGNLNIIIVAWGDLTATVSSITDSIGNPYVLAVGPTRYSTVLTQSIYHAKNILPACGPERSESGSAVRRSTRIFA